MLCAEVLEPLRHGALRRNQDVLAADAGKLLAAEIEDGLNPQLFEALLGQGVLGIAVDARNRVDEDPHGNLRSQGTR